MLNKAGAKSNRKKHVLDLMLLHNQRNYVRKQPNDIINPTAGSRKGRGNWHKFMLAANSIQHMKLNFNSCDFLPLLY